MTMQHSVIAPAPIFFWHRGGPSLATIYGSHYERLRAVVDAARSGNRTLIKLALEHHDKHGWSDGHGALPAVPADSPAGSQSEQAAS